MPQKEKILKFIVSNGDKATTNELKRFGVDNCIGCIDRRVRELVEDGQLISRKMTDDELNRYNYLTPVRIYELVEKGKVALLRQADHQETLADITYPKKKERIFSY